MTGEQIQDIWVYRFDIGEIGLCWRVTVGTQERREARAQIWALVACLQ